LIIILFGTVYQHFGPTDLAVLLIVITVVNFEKVSCSITIMRAERSKRRIIRTLAENRGRDKQLLEF
jgi:hypothetical protein